MCEETAEQSEDFVVPAKAGTRFFIPINEEQDQELDSRLRGNDDFLRISCDTQINE